MNDRNPSTKGAKSRYRTITARSRQQGRDARGRSAPGSSGLPESCTHISHGLQAMERGLAEVSHDEAWLDRLGPVGEAIKSWRDEIISDLGGDDSISAMQRVVVDSACKTYILLSSVDAWLLRQNPINKRKRSLYPIVRERQQLADALARYMQTLGLERRQIRSMNSKKSLDVKWSLILASFPFPT